MDENFTSEITKQSSTRTLSNIVSHIQNPKPEHEKRHGGRPMSLGITKPPPQVSGVTNNKNRDNDKQSSGHNKRSPAAEAVGAAVTHVANQGLNEEPGERAAEPYDAGPRVRDPELLHVGCEEGEL